MSERLLNAFDLVRVHLFPDEDEKISFQKMADFASQDEFGTYYKFYTKY